MYRIVLMSALALALGFAQPASANCGIGWGQQGQGEGCSDKEREDEGEGRELPAHDLGWVTLAALMLAGGVFAAKGALKPRAKL